MFLCFLVISFLFFLFLWIVATSVSLNCVEHYNTGELFIPSAAIIDRNDAGNVADPSPRPWDADSRAAGHRLLLLR